MNACAFRRPAAAHPTPRPVARAVTQAVAALLCTGALTNLSQGAEMCQAPANLVANPGFENGSPGSGASPTGWQFTSGYGTSTGLWDGSTAHSGQRSVRINALSADDATWSQAVPAPVNQLLYLGGWIKSDKVQPAGQPDSPGATVSILGRWDIPAPTLGTTPWHAVGFSFFGDTSPLNVTARLGFWGGMASGTAWFDDLVLVPRVAGTPHPRWKILVLLYPQTDVSYTDSQGLSHHVKGEMSQADIDAVTAQAHHFVEKDIPALSSGNMLPSVAVRIAPQPLKTLTPFFDGWWPAQGDVIANLDPAFDSVIVVWEPSGQDATTSAPVTIPGDGAVTPERGLSQTYTTIRLPLAGLDSRRDTYKQQWAIAISNYFLTMRLTPAPPISFNPAPGQYLNCTTGQGYGDSIYDNNAGFLHDFYSGQLAQAQDPQTCLGINAQAWAWGGAVTHSGSHPVFSTLERVDALLEQVKALSTARMLRHDAATRLEQILLSERHILALRLSPLARPGLSLFIKQVRDLVGRGQLLPHAGDLLIEAAGSAQACITP